MAEAAASRRRRRARSRRRAIALGTGVAVVALGGGAAWALSGSSGPSYRLATVARGTVRETVTTTGTIASVNRATLRFPVSGTVASVGVSLGDSVRAGQTVATLDSTSLQQQLQAAQATAASARQTLANDESGQTGGTGSSGQGGNGQNSNNVAANGVSATPLTSAPHTAASASHSGSGSGGGSGTAALIAAVKRAQQTLLADQHSADVDTDVANADKAVVAANAACAALLADTPAPTTPAPTATPTGTSTPTPTPTGSSSNPADDLQSCQDAISAVQAAQQKAQTDIDSLVGDERALDQAVSALLGALANSPTSGGPSATPSTGGSGRSSSSGGSGGSKTPSSSGSTGTVASAAQLAADQQRIDAADAEVTVAQQAAHQATLSTPISGTVAAVAISAGESVTAGSSTTTITIVGAGQESVTTTVPIGSIDLVKKGETATVTIDGVSTPLTGKVTMVGLLNSSGTSGTTTTYPVTIVLDDNGQQLFDGAGATVDIAVGSAQNVLTVPTSAVHGTGTATTVTVLRNGKAQTQRVTVGARGLDVVEVTSGLNAGDQVVLAEVSAPVPTSTNQSRLGSRVGGGLGGLGGGNAVFVPGGGRARGGG